MTGLNDERALLAELKFQLVSVVWELKFRRLVRTIKANFNPAQPRDERGRWTDAGRGINDPRIILDATPDGWIPGAQYAGNGHHFVPRGVFTNDKYNFSPETTRAFDSETTGHLKDPSSNQYDGVHRTYNKAVEEKLDQFLERNNITSREMTPEQAKSSQTKSRSRAIQEYASSIYEFICARSCVAFASSVVENRDWDTWERINTFTIKPGMLSIVRSSIS